MRYASGGRDAGQESDAWTVAATLSEAETSELLLRSRAPGAASVEERAMAALGASLAASEAGRSLLEDGVLTLDVEGIGRHHSEAQKICHEKSWR